MENEENEKNECFYKCICCDFKCSYMSDWNRHVTTRKHLVSLRGNNLEMKLGEKNERIEIHQCTNCNKIYKSSSGLWKHNKKCVNNKNDILFLVKDIVKQNQDLQKQIIDICKNGTNNITTNNTNSHNKTFNLQFFLNETCKDAMNIMDFVDSLKLQLSDLENVGKIGYVEGISSIIVKNLNSLDETKRPVHCTDSKREVMYIKDENKWEKENEEKKKLRKVIKHVAHKNSKMLNEYKQKYPNCDKSDSKYSDKYDKLIIEVMGGKGDNDLEKENKIIKNIAKEVIVEKSVL
jgi:hypothetical protein